MRNRILVLTVLLFSGGFCLADCPSADLTGDCFVDYEDFALMAAQWLTTDPCIPDDMVRIPGGTFDMGDSFDEGASYGFSGETPVHTVRLDSFYIGKYEITNQQYCNYLNDENSLSRINIVSGTVYASFDSSNSYPLCDTSTSSSNSQIDYSGGIFSVRTKAGRDMSYDPMVQVSWYGAAAYCNWCSRQEGYQRCYNLSTWDCDFGKQGYRLPTEAEWEYTARGGLSGKRFPWGDTITHDHANYNSSSSYPYDISPTRGNHPAWNDGIYPYTSSVGSFSANGYGLYDMAGNTWEWCNDWYQTDYYTDRPSPDLNPTGPTGPLTYRVLRGASWGDFAKRCRVAHRTDGGSSHRDWGTGFRIVLDLPADPYEPDGMVWVDINDPGVSGHEGFNGEMSKYETTNAQYCQYLNSAIDDGLITLHNDVVYAVSNTDHNEPYFETFAASDGSQIDYNNVSGSFSVRIRDNNDMSNHPVAEVSLYGATAFCNYYGYRLPTEWEWQAVADYNGGYTYGCGTSIDPNKANYSYANPLNLSTKPYTSPVGYYSSYGYGMNDMAGNMWEWTDSCYYADCDQDYRVVRGGCASSGDFFCTVSNRATRVHIRPDYTASCTGFRACR